MFGIASNFGIFHVALSGVLDLPYCASPRNCPCLLALVFLRPSALS